MLPGWPSKTGTRDSRRVHPSPRRCSRCTSQWETTSDRTEARPRDRPTLSVGLRLAPGTRESLNLVAHIPIGPAPSTGPTLPPSIWHRSSAPLNLPLFSSGSKRRSARSTRASRPGEAYLVPPLNQYCASRAIIRQVDRACPPIAEREAYIETLQRIVRGAIYALQKAGPDSQAARLRRAVERH
jgi:hypothetical protein